MKKILIAALFWGAGLWACQNGVVCSNGSCRVMSLDAVTFKSDGRVVGGGYSLEKDKDMWAVWKFVIPKDASLDEMSGLGSPFVRVNISCGVKQNGLSTEVWPSPYTPTLSISYSNLTTKMTAPIRSETIHLIDSARQRGGIAVMDYYVSMMEEGTELTVKLTRPAYLEAPTISVNKDSCWLTYIYRKGPPPSPPDPYEPNDDSESAYEIKEDRLEASIWDGKVIKPIDVDWYKFEMKKFSTFEIEVKPKEEKSKMMPSLELFNKQNKRIAFVKGRESATLTWQGMGIFCLKVSNANQTESSEMKYILTIIQK
ncbi:MAG: hypothetical protein V2A53_09750 [bacterium]